MWAPVLLVALRLLQGLAASGEQSGANSRTARASAADLGLAVPCWLSAIVTVAGLVIRRTLDDGPAFQQAADDGVLPVP